MPFYDRKLRNDIGKKLILAHDKMNNNIIVK